MWRKQSWSSEFLFFSHNFCVFLVHLVSGVVTKAGLSRLSGESKAFRIVLFQVGIRSSLTWSFPAALVFHICVIPYKIALSVVMKSRDTGVFCVAGGFPYPKAVFSMILVPSESRFSQSFLLCCVLPSPPPPPSTWWSWDLCATIFSWV